MTPRRRLLLDGSRKHYIFAEGSGEIINAGDYVFDNTNIGDFIGIDASKVAIVGDVTDTVQGYGYFKIRADFSGFDKLCIEVENTRNNTEGAVGYGATYSGNKRNPRLPSVSQSIGRSAPREVKQFDISKVNESQYIVGVLTYVSSLSAMNNVLKIYNIWLE